MQTAPEQFYSALPKIGQYSISKSRDTWMGKILWEILEEIKSRFLLNKDQFSTTLFIKVDLPKVP